MEIKVVNSYPLWLINILNENGLFRTSFSKYGTEYTNYIKKKMKKQEDILC